MSTYTAAVPAEQPLDSNRIHPGSTNATRYLCAAAYLDQAFCRVVLDEVLYQPHRAVAPSHGVSLKPILLHCLAARRRILVRDGLVTIALVLLFGMSFVAGLLALLTFFSFWLIRRGVRLLAARQTAPGVLAIVIALFLLPVPVIAVLTSSGTLLTLGYLLGLDPYSMPSSPLAGSGARAFGLFVDLAAIWTIYFVHRLMTHSTIASELTPTDSTRNAHLGPGVWATDI